MAQYKTMIYKKEGEIAIITLNRPERANSISGQWLRDINGCLDEVEGDNGVGAFIITGAGRFFCGGADLKEQEDRLDIDFFKRVQWRIENSPKPSIAAVNGSAMGGGCELAISCDFRIIADNTQIGVPEIKFGSLPIGGGTQRLPRLVGPQWGKYMVLTGNPLTPQEAFRIGLVLKVVPHAEIINEAKVLAQDLCNRARHAMRKGKLLITVGMKMDRDTALQWESEASKAMGSPEEMAAARAKAQELFPVYRKIF